MSKCNNKWDRQVFTDGLGERAKKRIVSSIQPDFPDKNYYAFSVTH